jgi:hypothetical protein
MSSNTTKGNGAESDDPVDVVTRWGLVGLSAVVMLATLFRVFGPGTSPPSDRLDQTTLLYLSVAGALLLLRQVKAFSVGQFKFELIEKLRERQDKQEERLADIALILPLLLPDSEVKHLKKLFANKTDGYSGNHDVRTELRRLRSLGLLSKKLGRNIADMKDGIIFDLDDYVELTDLGRRWAARIQEIEMR